MPELALHKHYNYVGLLLYLKCLLVNNKAMVLLNDCVPEDNDRTIMVKFIRK